jgi:4-hydroxy-2-oxoheptanedioate aldolase
MDLPRNAFKHALAEGRQQLGLWSQLSNGIAAEIIAGCKASTGSSSTGHGPKRSRR